MRSLLTLFTAFLFVTVIFTAPVQAQRAIVRPHLQKVKQPRVFKKKFRQHTARKMRARPRAARTGTRSINPRYYTPRAASRHAYHLKRRAHTRTRANVSPRRSMQQYGRSAEAVVKRIKRAQRRHIRRSTARPTRANPTFWK